MAVIYKATNTINGKSYIGYTSQEFKKRMAQHKAHCNDSSAFHQAIKKYGWNNFVWEVLKDEATLEDERFFILEFDSMNNGYNLTEGGECTRFSTDTKKKMSNSAKNKKVTNRFREKCSKRMMGNTISPGGKPKNYLIAYPSGDKERIENLTHFCTRMNLNVTHMSSVASGKRNHHRGFKVERVENVVL